MVGRRMSLGVVGALLALAVMGGGSVSARTPGPAGSPSLSVEATLGVPCLAVTYASSVGANEPLTIEQQRGATTISTKTVPVPVPFESTVCLKSLKAGDVLHITHGAQQRDTTVPGLTATMDTGTDVVSGRAPGAGSVVVNIQPRVGPILFGLFTPSLSVMVDGNGDWTSTAETDLKRGDSLKVQTTIGIDRWWVIVPTTTLAIQPGSAAVSGTAPASSTVSGTLLTRDGVVRGRFSAKTGPNLSSGDTFTGTFKKGGKAVKVRAGDRVRFSKFSGSYTVPAGTLKQTPGDTLSTTCAPGVRWMAASNGTWFISGTSDDAGRITGIDVSDAAIGSRITVACDTKAGWRLVRAVTIQ